MGLLSAVPVTNQNIREYILLVANHRQNVMIRSQCRAFLKGFRDMMELDWIRIFHVHELQLVIGGDRREIDIVDMKTHTVYESGYTSEAKDQQIQWFWEIVEQEMTREDHENLLRFMTSCPRQPLLGFSRLDPKLTIQKVSASGGMSTWHCSSDEEKQRFAPLPTAATCFNVLKLPAYDSKEVLREKLLYAIRSKSGFELQ
jgi:ubiquitin-protein ligase E3 C